MDIITKITDVMNKFEKNTATKIDFFKSKKGNLSSIMMRFSHDDDKIRTSNRSGKDLHAIHTFFAK